MKKLKLNSTALRFVCAGLLLQSFGILLPDFIIVIDFWKGFPVGLGLSLIIGGFMLQKKKQNNEKKIRI